MAIAPVLKSGVRKGSKVRITLIGVAGVIAAAFVACEKQATEPRTRNTSFAQLNRAILGPSCATSGCHVSGSAALSGNLVLTDNDAYANLVGALPTNLNARNDGLRRVMQFKPDSSLLYQKLVVALNARTSAYGGLMPVGVAPLTVGKIEFVRKWIEAGAPDTGFVADSLLLADATPQTTLDFTALDPPAAGAGYQVRADAFTVAPNFERELFELRPLGNTNAIYVNRIQTSMRPFSHHFVLYTMGSTNSICQPRPNVVRDIRNPDGSMNFDAMRPMACHVFLGGSMTQQGDYQFPPGVGLELPANAAIDVNVHYVNHTQGVVPGEAYANLYTMPAASVQKIAHTLNMSNMDFVIPPNTEATTASKVFTVSQKTTVFALTSHMHARGTRFEIRIFGGARGGELVYTNTDWEHPQFVTFATPIVLQPGEGLRSTVTWRNMTAKTVTFGLESTDEMAIIFGYYY